MRIACYIFAGLLFLVGVQAKASESPNWYTAAGVFIIAGNTLG